MRSNTYTFTFTLAVCVGCSLFVSLAAIGLRPQQELNYKVDRQRNILRSVGLPESTDHRLSPAEVQQLFRERIQGIVVDTNGNIVAGRKPEDVDPEKEPDLLPVYLRKDGSTITAYSIPVSGKGLWSTIYGYLALDPDGVTVRGITFYKHGETPGLGGEIEKPWFQNNFKGKKILDEQGRLTSITVVKGKVKDQIPPSEASHYVDGISGATLTGKGVTALLRHSLERYDPYFRKVRAEYHRP